MLPAPRNNIKNANLQGREFLIYNDIFLVVYQYQYLDL